MSSTHELRVMDAHRSSPGSTEGHPKPALAVRIWARLLAALHESREQEAAHVIRRHRDLIQNFQAIELSGHRMESFPMDDRQRRLRVTTGHISIAALAAGFALAIGFALYEIDAVAKDASSLLATIATTGGD